MSPTKMAEMTLKQQLEQLCELEQQLHILLAAEQYAEFERQQAVLAVQIKQLLTSHSPQSLSREVKKLRELEKNITRLQATAQASLSQLKNKSLLQKRNKKILKAYK